MAAAPEDPCPAGWASPALLEASFFLRACAQQALGEACISLEGELPRVPPSAMLAALALNLPEPRPSIEVLKEAGEALQAVVEQQPRPVCEPLKVFGEAAFAVRINALPLAALATLLACLAPCP